MKFEDAINRLDEICRLLQSGELKFDESLKIFEEGTKLISYCNAMLDDAEQKITILNYDGSEKVFNDEN